MGLFRDMLNEARNTSVPTEYRIALGQLKRMYNKGEVPTEKELQKDAEMIAKKNHIEEDKFFEFVKSQFKINESELVEARVQEMNEVYSRSIGFKQTEEAIKLLVRQLDVNSNLAKGIIKTSGNIYGKDFINMNKNITRINDIWDDMSVEILKESAVGTPGRTTVKDAEDHINDELVAEFKKIIKKLGGKTVAKVLLDKLGQKPEIKDEIEHIEDIIDNSNY